MSSKKPSQTDLYGELLTNEQQYRTDIRPFPPAKDLTQEEKEAFVERARRGDAEAREAIISHLLQRVERYAMSYVSAYSWASHRIEYADLIQEGNLALLLYLDQALATDHAYAYLTVCAYSAIRHYSKRFTSLIVTPLTQEVEPLYTESLDQPLPGEHEGTLMDLVGEFLVEDFSTQIATKDPEVFEPLYEAIETHLSPNQRFVVVNHYGLYDHAPLSLHEINQSLEKASTHQMREQALGKLYVCLSSAYREYAAGSPQAQAKTKTRDTTLTPEQEQRLQEASTRLQQRGQKITVDALRIEAQIAPLTARKYVARLHAEKPEPTNQERLDRAHAQMEARGEKITVEKLAASAHVLARIASGYLHCKRGTQPITLSTRPAQERLEEAYASLQARGEKITIKSLGREARCDSKLILRYLRERRAAQPDLMVAS